MQVEILAGDEDGPASLANFPVWCGAEPPRTFTVAPRVNDVPADPADAERHIFELVNRERKNLGRPPLAWDDGLAKAAREHSHDMLRTDAVTPRIPGGMSIEQRARAIRSDIKAYGTVARAYGVAEAHQGLIALPSTRAKLISSAATQIGVGVAYGRNLAGGMRELFITEVVAVPLSTRLSP